MSVYIKILIIVLLEIIVTILYIIITPKEKKSKYINVKSVVKGLVERAFLAYSLLSGFPHVLTLFGALKLGTRLKRADNENTKSGRLEESNYNDFFLIGNFISVALSIVYFNLLK